MKITANSGPAVVTSLHVQDIKLYFVSRLSGRELLIVLISPFLLGIFVYNKEILIQHCCHLSLLFVMSDKGKLDLIHFRTSTNPPTEWSLFNKAHY